jgi:8-oxo-dGTP diphosphatase
VRERPQVAVGAVVRDHAGRLLVIRRARPPAEGRWTVPGGRVEGGERVAEAVAREVREETGLTVEVGPLVGVHEIIGPDVHVVILDHHAEVVAGDAVAGDDAAAVSWMGRRELVGAGPTDGLLDFLDGHGIAIAP